MPVSKVSHGLFAFKKLNALWHDLIGSPDHFSLESRIFHSIAIGIVILAAIYVPYNFFAGLRIASLSGVVFVLVFSWQLYASRIKGRQHSSIIFALTGIIIFSVNYFSNAGINGSTDLIWPAYLLLVFAVAPYRQQTFWLTVYIACFFILHVLEYRYPQWVHYPFAPGNGQFIDRVTAFPIPAIAIYITIKFIRRSYDKERHQVNEKAAAIEVRNQQILQQTAQLELANAEKSKLMSIISHDLRAPLVNIQTYLELLNNEDIEPLQRSKFEKDLLSATRTTMNMLSNVLQWSKTQMDGTVVSLKNINLSQTLQSTFDLEKMMAKAKGLTFQYNIPPNITIIADADMLQLVVRNLTNNAIKFTPAGGSITIEAQQQLNDCRITVSDTGKGIPADKMSSIFTLNAQPTFGTNNERGAGLGLLLCKEFTERQGGRISFESSTDKGSRFFVFMPMA
ncbi:HAMP domain-containing sensor histidine kinase [Mucilaginibacter auburnensis]|uniref:histidine kinase n=1 Tax=Mucilaginibacter auburnensis TaxID=1457233 RepID=A0A2H9VQ43_9SPHI|nr:HAMP domain-containing sensor histidine kinase [Mucilaginibacter auburnensis]PJJ80410.1 signal transduction histidine kinase [Mucilaginibacter auburnensis]